MKEVHYTQLEKIETIISSIAIGCDHIKDINHKLRPFTSGANLLGMERFPDQSQINRFLNRFGPWEVSDLALIHEQLLRTFGLFRRCHKIDIDYDCSGLITYGKTYMFARKGYFPRKRGKRGYQLALGVPSSPELNEILYLQLDPGNMYHGARLWDCIYQVADLLGSLDKIGIIRTDAITGTIANIKELQECELDFIMRGRNSRTAYHIAETLCYDDWQMIDLFTRIADIPEKEIPGCRKPVRVILIEDRENKKQETKYIHIYTSISPKRMDAVEVRDDYNGRQTMESTIKVDKNGLGIRNLRTRNYYGIQAFLYLAAITHNLLALFRDRVLSTTGLADIGITELTQKLMDIPAKIHTNNEQLQLLFPAGHKYSQAFFRGNGSDL